MIRINLFKDDEGEPRIWSHGINESARKKPGSFPWHARWFLHFPKGCLSIEWSIKRIAKMMFLLHVGEGDTSEISLWIGIPFILSLYLTLEHFQLSRIVPTVRTKSYVHPGEFFDMPITRSLGFRVFDGHIWIDLWADPNDSGHNKRWQQFNWGPQDFFLGRMRYTQYDERRHETVIVMPEGRYPATITTYIAYWKRQRWPFAKRMRRAEIEVKGGIPVPGKGENSWDMDDDAIFSMTTPAINVHEAQRKIFDSAMRDRIKYAAADWIPDKGWPAHMISTN